MHVKSLKILKSRLTENTSPIKLQIRFRTKNHIKHTNPLCRVLLVKQTYSTVLPGVSETQEIKTRNTAWYSSQRFAIRWGRGGAGPDNLGIRTTEGKLLDMGHRKESTQCYSKTPQSENTVSKSIIIIIIIITTITYCDYKFNGTFWAIFGSKMSEPHRGPDGRGTDYTGTTVWTSENPPTHKDTTVNTYIASSATNNYEQLQNVSESI